VKNKHKGLDLFASQTSRLSPNYKTASWPQKTKGTRWTLDWSELLLLDQLTPSATMQLTNLMQSFLSDRSENMLLSPCLAWL